MKLAVATRSSRPRAAAAGLGTAGCLLAATMVAALILRGPLAFGPWPSAAGPPTDGTVRAGAGAAYVGERSATAATDVPTPLRAPAASARRAGALALVGRLRGNPRRGAPGRDPVPRRRAPEQGARPGSTDASTAAGLRLGALPIRIRATTRVLGADLSRTGQVLADALAPLSPSAGRAVGRTAAGAGAAVMRLGRAVAERLGDVRRRPRTDVVSGPAPAPAAGLPRLLR